MVNYPAPSFPNGTVLTVVRQGARDYRGDRSPSTTHTVGPCDLKWVGNREDNTDGEQVTISAQVTAPAGSDITPSDVILHPDGREFHLDGEVTPLAPNPFTGWATGVRFLITHAR